jgi:hypothetical protein
MRLFIYDVSIYTLYICVCVCVCIYICLYELVCFYMYMSLYTLYVCMYVCMGNKTIINYIKSQRLG